MTRDTASNNGLLLVGHGSRHQDANAEFEALVASCRDTYPDIHVGHGYLELAQPLLDDALANLARKATDIVAVPVFLFGASHIKNDIPLALARARAAFPQVRFSAARPLGVHPAMVQVAVQRLVAATGPIEPAQREKLAVLVVGRGAKDPDANGDFYKQVRLIGEGQGFGWVLPAFIGITAPHVPQTLEYIARLRPQRLVVLPYFLFKGRLLATLDAHVDHFARQFPWIKTTVAAPLGAPPALLGLLHERCEAARTAQAPLPCDTCQYRAPIGAVAGEVGGLKALLWSLRHTFTHGQAMPHVHAHRPLHKHVLVCANVDCAAAGSMALINRLRRLIKAAGRTHDIRVTRTACMGRCGEGPTLAVYPDGVWYRTVHEADAAELVDEHLLGDRLVARLVDNIMQ